MTWLRGKSLNSELDSMNGAFLQDMTVQSFKQMRIDPHETAREYLEAINGAPCEEGINRLVEVTYIRIPRRLL